MENIRLLFVLPEKCSNENEVSQIMKQAYETCKQNVKTDVVWVRESDFDSITVNKTDFIIFEDFKGPVFENLKETKCARILGPWAVSICLVEGKPIPNYPWPIYNVAMYECMVTCSNMPKIKKMEIKEKVQLMGGCYIDTLVEKITHLVTDSPKSEKYLAAAEVGVKLMCSSWIEAVWKASQLSNIHANEEEFEEHKCLPFQNLNISCTGLTDVKRKEIEKLITKYGGKYSARLKLAEADVLLCAGADVLMSEKYKAARSRSNIKCVDASWVTESIKRGYALPHHEFQVKKATSTPNKNDNPLNPDFSILSAISMVNVGETTVDATVHVKSSPGCFGSPRIKMGSSKRKGNLRDDYSQLVDNLDIKKAKKAGQYLDGCSVYITGFGPEHTEKLCKILNLSGATRYDQFSDRVTHVIVGDSKFHEVNIIKSKGYPCSLVSVQWLLDSIESEQAVDEEKYLLSISDVDKSEFSSPLSRKGLNLLRTDKTIVEVDEGEMENTLQDVGNNAEKEIIQQYLKPTVTVQEDDDTLARLLKNADNFPDFSNEVQEPPSGTPHFHPAETSTQETTTMVTQDETSDSKTQTFEGLKFLLIGFEQNDFHSIKELIEGFSGSLVPKTYKGIPDFIVVPIFNKSEIRHTAKEIVNELFIKECASYGALLTDICYYHRPFDVPDTNPLVNCVITISGFGTQERNFLKQLIVKLGGYHQEQFSRVTSEAKKVVASTHLVSDKASGKKYQAAVKWGLLAVNGNWLLECAKRGSRVPEFDYLLGDTVPSENISAAGTKLTRTSFTKPTTENTPVSSRRQTYEQMSNNPTTPSVDAENMQQNMSNLSCLAKFHTPTGVSVSRNATPEVSAALGDDCPSSSKSSRVLTPVNQILRRQIDFNDSPNRDNVFSQATPVNKILMQYRESNRELTPSNESPERFLWMGIKTPETPLGACMVDNPSPQLRKQCELWLKQFPDYEPPLQRRLSTPLSDIKRKLWDKILKRGEFAQSSQQLNVEQDDHINDAEEMDIGEVKELLTGEDSPHNKLIHNKLQQMEEMLSASGSGKRQSRNFHSTIPIPEGNKEYKDSQVCTVGWDFREQEVAPKPPKIFILTGVGENERATMVEQLESLGATVSDLSNYDPSSTHLLCSKPARNEKVLSCMAAGKWILHTSYLEKSLEAGHFLDEEEFEFGNPKSIGKFSVKFDRDTETRMKSMHWWRKEVSRRGYGAFNDMRAIVIAQKRDPIVRVIEAGGGLTIDVSPPFEDTVHATHCLLEQRSVRDYADYVPLAQQGVYLLNTVYISDYLHQPNKDIRECILPYFAKYYSRS